MQSGHQMIALTGTGRALAALVLLACLGFSAGLGAQPASPWILSGGEAGDTVELDAAALRALRPGDRFDVVLPNGEWQARIEEVRRFPNGDSSLHALFENASPHTLVMTLGGSAIYGSLSSPQGLYRFQASPDSGGFAGPLTRHTPLKANSPASGLVTPPGAAPSPIGDFTLRQTASADPLPMGDELRIDLEVVNVSGDLRRQTYADIFFLLEDTALLSAPPYCAPQRDSEGLPVLSCALGDLAAGEKRQVSYTVATDAGSHPLVYSTAVVGRAFDELIVEVYRDVLRDSDDDGLSDHNEVLLGFDPLDPLSTGGRGTTVIDVLPVFAADVEELYQDGAQTRFNQLLAMANAIYRESGVSVRLRQAGALRTAYRPAASLEEDLRALTYAGDPAFDPIDRVRTIEGADLVVLLRTMGAGERLCGLANLGGKALQGDFSAEYQKLYAYSVVNLDCADDSVLAHELGHNMGLVHSRLEEPEGGTFAHAAGYGRPPEDGLPGFATVMAHGADYGTDNKIFRFSNPRLWCSEGDRCGQDPSDPVAGADAAAVLDFVRHQIAAYFPSVEQRLTDLGVLSQPESDPPPRARILAGVSADGGYSYRDSFAPEEAVSVRALLKPDPDHVGREAVLHAVFRLGEQGFFQYGPDGELTEWNTKVMSLEPQGAPVVLGEEVRFDPLRDFDALARGLAGQRVAVFVAYRLADTEDGPLVRAAQPLAFRFDAPSTAATAE